MLLLVRMRCNNLYNIYVILIGLILFCAKLHANVCRLRKNDLCVETPKCRKIDMKMTLMKLVTVLNPHRPQHTLSETHSLVLPE